MDTSIASQVGIGLFEHYVFAFFQGSLWVLLIVNVLLYVQTKMKVNCHYALYLLFMSVNFFNVKFNLVSSIFPALLTSTYLAKLEVYYFEAFMYICYFMFIKSYLGSKTEYPKIFLLLNIMMLNSVIEILFTNTCFLLGKYELAYPVINGLKILNMLCAIGLIPLFYRKYNKLIKYLFAGGVCLLLGTVLFFTTLNMELFKSSYFQPVYFLYLGIIAELIIFSLGIGYRLSLIQEEKLVIQTALVKELRDKELYQQDLNQKMKVEIRNQTTLIETQSKDLMKTRLSKINLENKFKNLSAQMNPHFIFNALSTLKYYFHKKEDPTEYIDNLATMVRGIMNQSRKKSIPLDEEIETIKSYIALEEGKFDQGLETDIILDPRIDPQMTSVPPMMIQPLIENAIVHGLKPIKDQKPKIKISFEQEEEDLRITIEDNGVGRQQSAKKVSADTKAHLSVSSKILKERLSLINKNGNKKLKYHDLQDSNGNAIGTRVQIVIEGAC